MTSSAHQSPLKIMANKAAADANGKAAKSPDPFAAFVPIRWQQPGYPPAQNVSSAVSPLSPAVQFSGNSAIYAINAGSIATSVPFSTSPILNAYL